MRKFKNTFFVFMLMILCNKIMFSQNLSFGAALSGYNISIEKLNQSDSFFSIANLNSHIEVEFDSSWVFSLQPGILITMDQPYNGFEINTLIRYEFEWRREYLTAGINMLNNKSGSSSARYSNGEFLINGLIGAGTFFSNNIFAQVSLIYPLSRSEIGYFQTKNTLGFIEKSPIKFSYIFKLSVGFIIDL